MFNEKILRGNTYAILKNVNRNIDPNPKFPFKIKDDLIDQIYEHNKDEDGFLYITFSDMEVYGN